MSFLAWNILALLLSQKRSVMPTQGECNYLASWTIGERLGGDAATIDPIALKYTPRNAQERAMRDLLDLGLIEEMEELPCRYRLVVK